MTAPTQSGNADQKNAKAIFRLPIELWHEVLEAQPMQDNAERYAQARALRDAVPTLCEALRPTVRRLARVCRAEADLFDDMAAPPGVVPLAQLSPRARFERRLAPLEAAPKPKATPALREAARCVARSGSLTLVGLPQLDAVRVNHLSFFQEQLQEYSLRYGRAALHAEQMFRARNLLRQLGPSLQLLDLSDSPVADIFRRSVHPLSAFDPALPQQDLDWDAYACHALFVRRVERTFRAMRKLHTLRLRGAQVHPCLLKVLPLEQMQLHTLDVSQSTLTELRLRRLHRGAQLGQLVALDLPNCYEETLARFLSFWPEGLGALTISGPNLFAGAPILVESLPPEVRLDVVGDVMHFVQRARPAQD